MALLLITTEAVAGLGAPMSPLNNPCLTEPFASLPWCDHSLAVDDRVADMVSRMNITEKIANLDTQAPAIPSLGLNAYNWWSEATHGLSHVNNSGSTPGSTNFAFPITTSMSFNRSLWHQTGAAISREARAFMNAGHAYSTYWAPVINLAREPRWGRNLESAGEDPYVSGEYAASFVRGFEHLPDDERYLAASACCKHYVANSMEDSRTVNIHHTRYSADPNITMQDLVDSYMAPFQACVEKGRVSSLMCSYNAVNGIPTCANPWLLETVARKAWGFDGYITSDCDAVANVVAPHRYVKTAEEAVAVTLEAGMDVDCSYFVGQHGARALALGLINETLIDTHLKALFKVRMRLQHFDPPGPLQEIQTSAICTEQTAAIARAGVVQSGALYKNLNNTLPLNATGVKSVAVIGPNGNLSQSMAGYYGPTAVCGDKFPSMIDAIQSHLDGMKVDLKVDYVPGVPNVLSDDTSNISVAAEVAKTADLVVLVLGTDISVACENRDAVNITFSDGQLELVKTVAAAATAPVTVVTLTAVPLDLTPLLLNPKVGAILHAGQPSIQTHGVADLLFGAASPAGRAVQMVYPASYQHMISPMDFNMRPGPSRWPRPDSPGPCTDPMKGPIVPDKNCSLGTNPGRTHRFFNGTAVIPFGFGLSYTSWSYSIVSAPKSAVDLNPLRELLATTKGSTGTHFPRLENVPPAGQYVIEVTNTGKLDADDVVLGFISPPGAGTNGIPLQSLFGFERIHVRAGQSEIVDLYPALTEFASTNLAGDRSPLEGEYRVSFGVAETADYGMGYISTSLLASF